MDKDPRFDRILSEINRSIADANLDRGNRKEALVALEELEEPTPRRVAVYYSDTRRSISRDDVLPFLNMLKSIGRTENLDLVLVSPGGDAMAAEKMLDLCRKYCTGELRVVVPLYAKSAATLLALGADEIVMGESSELGPMDAQVYIIQDNQDQQVSADHFLRAYKDAREDLASSDPKNVQAAQIQLALLSPAFLQHCRDLMEFSQDFASKQLRKYMFRDEHTQNAKVWDERINLIIENLTSSSRHLLHGRMITAHDIKEDTDLQHLKVKELDSADPYWTHLTELLLRTEIVKQRGEFGKMLFARDFQLVSG